MPTATYEIDTHYHLDEIKSVLIDFRNYPNFLSSIEHVDINLTNNPIWEVVFVTHLIRRMQYELRLQLEEFPEYVDYIGHYSKVFSKQYRKLETHQLKWYQILQYHFNNPKTHLQTPFRLSFEFLCPTCPEIDEIEKTSDVIS